MRIEINLLARRPVKIMHLFEIGDIFLLILFGFLMPFAGMIFFNINFIWSLCVTTIPVVYFVFRFRVRRRSGYSFHTGRYGRLSSTDSSAQRRRWRLSIRRATSTVA